MFGSSAGTTTEAEATAQVQSYAEAVAALLGDAALENRATNAASCVGRRGERSTEIFFVQGVYQLPVPADRHLAILDRVREHWQLRGYAITDDRTLSESGTGTLSAINPVDGYSVALQSTTPPEAFALFVHSRCHRSPVPRY
jgi:hypothetical protein